tara:strand:+ start:1694 stop:2233 length:540 start_codon:yes stop_codon:yes gene_type:complete
MAKFTIIIGCMFSGKSTKIFELYKKYKKDNKNILLINHQKDTRYGNNVISTHNKKQLPCFSCLNLKSIANTNQYNNSNVIMIDEAQFFPDLFDFVTNAIDVDNKEIVIAGLDGDYKRQPFGDILKLIPHSDNIIKLKARCNLCDMENAIFTKRIVDSNKQFLVGGSESYIPVCRKHYIS